MEKIKILVVDDEAELCELIRAGLTHLSESYQIKIAHSGSEAMKLLEKSKYDVLVTDIRMPDINGLELLNRSKDIQEDLQSIVITGHGDLDNAIKALQMGVINYIKKPISLEVLHYSIQKGIEKRELSAKLQKSEEKYRILAETIIDMIIMYDVRGNILYVNRAGLNALGYTPRDLIKMNITEIISPADHSFFKEKFKLLKSKTENDQFFEIGFRDHSGKVIPVEVGTSCILEGSKVSAVLTIARDITDRKVAEEEIRRTNEQLRNLSAHLQSVREEERTNIAREVHDELGQSLTAMKMDLSWIEKQLSETHDKLKSKTHSLISLVDGTIQTVKRICSELRPTLLDDLGLAAAIEWQAEEFQRRTDIITHVSIVPEDVQPESQLAITLFRIVQEALTNVARHSGAKNVRIKVHAQRDNISLEVHDDGKGILEENMAKPNSFGLLGIRERVFNWGGEVNFINKNGTLVSVKIPRGSNKS
ncbi:MAG: PAS domain S-box protein [FCB group bacterium]|nr:PAS domain S-box protein [FCB group bacterium]